MGSEGKNMNDATSYQPSDPVLCANGCGFFGTAATRNLCSKCYNSSRLQDEQQVAAKVAIDKLVNPVSFAPETVVKASTSSSAVSELVEKIDDPVSAAAAEAAVVVAVAKTSNRCLICNKKIGIMGFNCRCGCTYCGVHRYPEKHDCTFDFRSEGREAIAKANPVVKGDKIQRF